MTMMNGNGETNGEMNGETNGTDNRDTERPTTPTLQPDKVLEVEALEELLRQETLRQIEAAWNAQRRLMQSCIAPPPVKVLGNPVEDRVMPDQDEKVPFSISKEAEEAGVLPPTGAEEESPIIVVDETTAA